MSMAYICEVFERLLRLGMGIRFHTHTVNNTDASQDLGKLAEILPDVSVQTMPQSFDCGCRMFQTASHVHGMHMRGLNWVEFILAVWLWCLPKLYLLFLIWCKSWRDDYFDAKFTSTCFSSKTSRFYLVAKDIATIFWRWPWYMYEMRCTHEILGLHFFVIQWCIGRWNLSIWQYNWTCENAHLIWSCSISSQD